MTEIVTRTMPDGSTKEFVKRDLDSEPMTDKETAMVKSAIRARANRLREPSVFYDVDQEFAKASPQYIQLRFDSLIDELGDHESDFREYIKRQNKVVQQLIDSGEIADMVDYVVLDHGYHLGASGEDSPAFRFLQREGFTKKDGETEVIDRETLRGLSLEEKVQLLKDFEIYTAERS